MRKNVWIKLAAMLFCFLIVVQIDNVNAACSTKELNRLKQKASNIKFNYELADSTYNEIHVYYFNVYATNFSKEFYFLDLDNQDFRYMPNLEVEGSRKLRAVKEGTEYKISIYTSNETSCPNTKISTKRIKIPYYNDYSQREECKGIEEFSLCQKYYGGYIESEEYFKAQVEKYKNGDIEEPKEKEGIFQLILAFLTNNLLIVIPCVLVLVIVIVLVIRNIRKSKKRTKIKL